MTKIQFDINKLLSLINNGIPEEDKLTVDLLLYILEIYKYIPKDPIIRSNYLRYYNRRIIIKNITNCEVMFNIDRYVFYRHNTLPDIFIWSTFNYQNVFSEIEFNTDHIAIIHSHGLFTCELRDISEYY